MAAPTNNRPSSPTPQLCVGVVGLGHMGEAFARNLLEDDRRVLAFDRNPARSTALRGAGAAAAARMDELAIHHEAISDSRRVCCQAPVCEDLVDLLREGRIDGLRPCGLRQEKSRHQQ